MCSEVSKSWLSVGPSSGRTPPLRGKSISTATSYVFSKMWLRWISRSGLKWSREGNRWPTGHICGPRSVGVLAWAIVFVTIRGARRVQGGSKGNWDLNLHLSEEVRSRWPQVDFPVGLFGLRGGWRYSESLCVVERSLNILVQGIWVKLKKWEGLCEIMRGVDKGICSD